MIIDIYFMVPESKVVQVYNLVRREYDLVGISEENKVQRDIETARSGAVLVYEDKKGQGIFRVKFVKRRRDPDKSPYVGCVYWVRRLNEVIERQDPMRKVIRRISECLGDVETIDTRGRRIYLEKLL